MAPPSAPYRAAIAQPVPAPPSYRYWPSELRLLPACWLYACITGVTAAPGGRRLITPAHIMNSRTTKRAACLMAVQWMYRSSGGRMRRGEGRGGQSNVALLPSLPPSYILLISSPSFDKLHLLLPNNDISPWNRDKIHNWNLHHWLLGLQPPLMSSLLLFTLFLLSLDSCFTLKPVFFISQYFPFCLWFVQPCVSPRLLNNLSPASRHLAFRLCFTAASCHIVFVAFSEWISCLSASTAFAFLSEPAHFFDWLPH